MPSPALIPRPQQFRPRRGVITWTSPLLVRGELDDPVVAAFCADLERGLGLATRPPLDTEMPQLDLRPTATPPGGYVVEIDTVTTVEAGDPEGLAAALATLRQLLPDAVYAAGGSSGPIELPRCRITDAPRFAWRGAHLDVARHFFDVEVVCRFIEHLGAHKFNRLHLHLNDDQGWRVELPRWPALTTVGAWRRSSPVGRIGEHADDGIPHGGFYRAEDLERLRACAERYAITLVPEIDLPGHAQAVVAAYPHLGCHPDGPPVEVRTEWGISTEVLAPSPAALDFAAEVVVAVAELFPGSPVHIGGDECPTVAWEQSEVGAEAMAAHGLREARELQGLFTTRLAETLAERGRPCIAWDEVLDANPPPDLIIAAWRHVLLGILAARAGHRVIMAPMEFTYLDWANTEDPSEPMAILPPPFATPWEKVYAFDPIPSELEEEFHGAILGTQAQLWTEYISTEEHLNYMAYPRLVAFSEVAWGTTTTVAHFRPRLRRHLARLEAMGIGFRPLEER